MEFITELEDEQWIVDRLKGHEGHDIDINIIDDEISLYCNDCQESVLLFYRKLI